MAELTYKQREKLEEKSKNFALPKEKKYPLVNAQGKPSRSHAANAKARATQMYDKGKLSLSEKERIDAKANKVLKKTETSHRSASTMKREKPEKKEKRRDERREMDRKEKRSGERKEKGKMEKKEKKMKEHEMEENKNLRGLQGKLDKLKKIQRR